MKKEARFTSQVSRLDGGGDRSRACDSRAGFRIKRESRLLLSSETLKWSGFGKERLFDNFFRKPSG